VVCLSVDVGGDGGGDFFFSLLESEDFESSGEDFGAWEVDVLLLELRLSFL
tara:strand:+ start:1414 stop:1566 length:153 start_codon:yes stop_codon:yes gene_type:complete